MGAFSLAGGVTAQTATPTASPGAAVTAIATALQSALDRDDVAAAMSLVTDDISVGGQGPVCAAASSCVGKAAVQREFQRRVDERNQRVRLNVQVVGNTVTTIFEVRGPNTRRCNVERILVSEVNDVRGSLVAAQLSRFDLTDAQTVALLACVRAAAAAQAAPAPAKTGSLGIAGSDAPARWLIVAMLAATLMLIGGVRRATAHRR